MKSGNFAAFYDYTDNGNVEQAQFYNPDPNFDLPATHRHYHQDFAYDRLSRLTGADYGFGTAGSSAWFDVGNLSYDLAGNMESLRRADETGTLIDQLRYDYSGSSNRLQAVTDSSGVSLGWDAESASFGYDANGNLISQTGKFNDIAYDHRNLPVHFYMDGGDEVVANYNADGQRILKELKGEAWTFYVMDGSQTLAVVDQSGFSHFNLVGNDVFGRYDDSGARRYYVKDHLGSTRAVVDDNGTVLESFDYYPFGLLMPKRNTSNAGTMEKFTGHERDDEIGLDHMVARMYDPAVARFHGVDPLSDEFSSWSPYTYVFNNPLIFTDPTGMSPICGENQSCDETYSVGSIVENRLGSWEYLGNNQWETLSLTENATEITSGIGRAWHRFTNTLDEFHNFGDRTIAENTSNVVSLSMMDNAGSWVVGGPVRGVATVAAKTGTTVLGKYPQYIELAGKMNARKFNIPTSVWNKMTPAEQWAANVKFLDRTVARGDNILLANPVKNISKVSGYFRKELDYLTGKGYRLSKDGTQLIK